MPALHCLCFDASLDTEGVHTFDAQAACRVSDVTLAQVAQAEAQQVLAWASLHFPEGPGNLDEGASWCHDLQLNNDGQWLTVSLSVSGTAAFGEAFARAFAGAINGMTD